MKPLILSVLLLLPLFPAVVRANYLFPAFPDLPSFNDPIGVEDPLDDTDRLFVVERAGRIYVFENDATVATRSLFLDITSMVTTLTEGGLLGLAFHPDYENNQYFYVVYTNNSPRRTILSRFTADASNPSQALPGSELRLLEIPKVNLFHNGGRIAFGPDGYLYMSIGEDGFPSYSQDLTRLNGKLLRIDVDNPSGGKNYGIPASNPFAGNPNGYREEIWAYGFRNPWRFSFDPPTGRLWLADVGQDTWEEVNLVKKGRNYGWPRMEGNECYSPSSCDTSGLHIVPPLFVYEHDGSASITGGFVYRGPSMPGLVGKYVYADYITGDIWALSYDGVHPPTNSSLESLGSIPSFGVDKDGELFIVSFDGTVYRLFQSSTSVRTPGPALGSFDLVHPNPFQSSATIEFSLAARARVTLEVFDVAGRRVTTLVDEAMSEGAHAATWNGRDADGHAVPSGVYMCRLSAGGHVVGVGRVTLLK